MSHTSCIRQHGASRKRLTVALILGLIYLVVAFVGSVLSDSLTLLASAGHMMFHNGSIIVGLIATTIAMKAPSHRFSSGYNKIEALGGYTNALILIIISGMIVMEATSDSHEGHAHANLDTFFHIEEMVTGHDDAHDHHGHDDHEEAEHEQHDHEAHGHDMQDEHMLHASETEHDVHDEHAHTIDPKITAIVATIGLVLHLLGAVVLYGGRHENLCVKGAYLCIFYDIVSIFVAFAVSALAYFKGLHNMDIYGALIVAIMLFISAIRLLKQSVYQAMDGTPEHIKYTDVVSTLESVEHIKNVHDVIIRNVGGGHVSISAHLVMSNTCIKEGHWEDCRTKAENLLAEKFNATSCTLQLECAPDCNHEHH